MKKYFSFFFILFALLSSEASAQVVAHVPSGVRVGPPFNYGRDFRMILERTKDKNDTLHYNKLLRRFLENDSTLTRGETLALLIGYTENPHYKPLEMMEDEKEIIELNDHGYYEDALDESKKYLAKHPLSLSINKERSFAYNQLRNRDSARFFMSLADKIMEAMIYSGDGKGNKPEIAFFSLGLNDGDYFIPNVGLSVTGKRTQLDGAKRLLYVTTALSDDNVYKTYYFQIHHAKLKMDGDEVRERQENKKLKKAKAKRKKGKVKAEQEPEDSTTVSDDQPVPDANEEITETVPDAPVTGEDSLQTEQPVIEQMIDSTQKVENNPPVEPAAPEVPPAEQQPPTPPEPVENQINKEE